jgi:uncharacterized oxidoreductase
VPTLTAPALTELVTRIFEAVGVPSAEAALVASSLVGANLRGHDSHGVLRVPQYVDFLERGEYQIGVELLITREGPAVVVCDGQWGLGQIQAHRLLDLILPRASVLGLAAGAGQRFGHIGRLGEYAERAVEAGLILLATVNNHGSGQRVAPPGGIEPRLGTNPLCVAVPTEEGPIVLDFGTSVVAEGKVRVYHQNGNRPVPPGWLLDAQGRPTTNPSVLYQTPLGSILPLGGAHAYKGFGLGLVLDILAGGLSGGRTCYPGAPAAKGNDVLFLALDPALFAGRDVLVRAATELASYVRSTPRAEGVEVVLLPGDPERLTWRRRSSEGIPIEPGPWERLIGVAERLGVNVPEVGA